ncbi:MAG: hypothetical protein H6822_18625 [Planctomycetaceae bacterium]|nr:hypothetical protein [Planctomycetales bacterium]MCB9924203.1 hypothetical protein [Planctomycetaceae bacterium]
MRRWQLVLFALAFITAMIFVIPVFVRDARQRQFDAAQRIVESHGGQLSFDLVDGNYMLDLSGDAASDATIQKLMPTLKDLPTGFTLLGPGESRQFWLNLNGESLTDAGLDLLCDLEISWMTLAGGSITDTSAARLSSADELHGIILNNVKLSESAVAALRASKPNAMVEINGASE